MLLTLLWLFHQVWAGPQSDGSIVAVLFNRSPAAANITANFSQIGITAAQATVRDMWAHVGLGTFTGSFTTSVASHDVAALRIFPVASTMAEVSLA